MAKVKLGGMIGSVSGSVGGQTYSRNRYGTYVRIRAVPTLVQNEYTTGVREAFADASRAWFALESKQQDAWAEWSKMNPVVDRLGEKVILAGNAAYIRINAFLIQAGLSQRDEPPVGENPAALTGLTLNADIGDGNVEAVFTPTPLAADTHVVIEGALRQTIGQQYLRNAWKLLKISNAAATSPVNLETEFIARFGSLQVGQILHIRARVLTGSLGLLSAPQVAYAMVEESET